MVIGTSNNENAVIGTFRTSNNDNKIIRLMFFFLFLVCVAYGFIGFFCGVVSIATLAAISYARYIKVCGVKHGMLSCLINVTEVKHVKLLQFKSNFSFI